MFSLIPSDANDPQGLMRRKEPNKQTNKQANIFLSSWRNRELQMSAESMYVVMVK